MTMDIVQKKSLLFFTYIEMTPAEGEVPQIST